MAARILLAVAGAYCSARRARIAAACWKRTWCHGNVSAVTPGATMPAMIASASVMVLREPGANDAM